MAVESGGADEGLGSGGADLDAQLEDFYGDKRSTQTEERRQTVMTDNETLKEHVKTLERILSAKRRFIDSQAIEIEALQELCRRAADALEMWAKWPKVTDLITELRKAAE